MKEYHFKFNATHEVYLTRTFHFMIRNKLDLIENTINIIESFLAGRISISQASCNKILDTDEYFISIINGKMRRIFLFSQHQYTSFYFPFDVNPNTTGQFDVDFKFNDSVVKIDFSVISYLRQLINDLRNNHVLDSVLENLWELDGQKNLKDFVISLLLMEDGYLRYDHDKLRAEEIYHPEHHLDFFYSQNSTFKLGLSEKPFPEKIINLLNIKEKCEYIR